MSLMKVLNNTGPSISLLGYSDSPTVGLCATDHYPVGPEVRLPLDINVLPKASLLPTLRAHDTGIDGPVMTILVFFF